MNSKRSASTYFSNLYELLSNMQVTDELGIAVPLDEGMDAAVEMILSTKPSLDKVMLVGNGGSASIAGHMQNDLCKAVGVRAIVFNEPSLLTALSNDHGYECVFARPVELWADARDLLVAISSSGRSENILGAVRAALSRGCRVITFSGFDAENPLRGLGHINFYVASAAYGNVELAHSVLAHSLTDFALVLQGQKEPLHE